MLCDWSKGLIVFSIYYKHWKCYVHSLYSLCMVFGHGARCRFSTKRHNECSWTKPKNQVWYLIFPPKSQSNQYNKNITLTDAYTHKILALIPSVTFYLFWVCTSLCLWISNILYSRRNLLSKSWTVIATPPSCVLVDYCGQRAVCFSSCPFDTIFGHSPGISKYKNYCHSPRFATRI